VIAGIVVFVISFTTITASATGTYDVDVDAHVRGVVLFVGDSNEVRAGTAINFAFLNRPNAYLPTVAARSGIGIRGSPFCSSCADSDFWKVKLSGVTANIPKFSAVVVDLGINDSYGPGPTTTATRPGYSFYADKIDWLMQQLPADTPILWTNLPCSVEPAIAVTGCKIVNGALSSAPQRWPNLTVVDWRGVAFNKPSYMEAKGSVHYSTTGYAAWSKIVVDALDAHTSA
jgi:hypothetical protein